MSNDGDKSNLIPSCHVNAPVGGGGHLNVLSGLSKNSRKKGLFSQSSTVRA